VLVINSLIPSLYLFTVTQTQIPLPPSCCYCCYNRAQFVSVLEFKHDLSSVVDKLFERIDNDGDGRIDGLEFLGGITLCCRGTFEEKGEGRKEVWGCRGCR